VRRVRVGDATGIAELGRIVDPNVLSTPQTVRELLEAVTPPTTERLVGDSSGRVLAWAPSGLYRSATGWVWIGGRPESRGRGIGGAIYAPVEARLRRYGADRIETTPNDEQGRRFLISRGFEVAATVRRSEIDPRRVAITFPVPAGVEVVAVRRV